ncbi:3-deoxy-D-manno-octulosonate cytidylyltransferase [Campylobacter rectus RM3267]|uniref:3-deoxy-D-manno-octulosonate cytidylyltransferase n=2 Tax=Campylobacter rectus TaxID=203 RepID=A0A6G5QMV8_CAMRE|nr:3-deoxy-manno-octulosonate cytidylyltransferase [Campylobacter rectus]EEF13313.1 3-deoxy-D-manno-octulosonate cytidylyltransferase [Campylobacter rectus RM3267]QCD47048.1 3-deoxy-D-manno-octulosonate cytidylyltransferase [Campylobacter rectus]UEB47747.1 3-deoxy-manno-octulosonate cytidylyltransferase [Campylobacter rectus]
MIIIPARLASTRMPNKILREINGVPMFVATARRVSTADEVAIAADDEGVVQIAQKFGFKAVMTSRAHQSGTDRINEAAGILGVKDSEIIINVQADEPFIEPENIVKFREFCEKNAARAFMFSCFKIVGSELADDKNLVKVVTDDAGYALYFSRSRIPFDRAPFDAYKAHLGIYGYSAANLKRFCSFAPSTLENTEKLEQLRALSNGEKILMLEVQSDSIGIDCEDDLQRAQAKFGIEVN